jgi:hypothetical protein
MSTLVPTGLVKTCINRVQTWFEYPHTYKKGIMYFAPTNETRLESLLYSLYELFESCPTSHPIRPYDTKNTRSKKTQPSPV